MKSVCHDSGRGLISTADLDDGAEVDESAMEIEEFVYRNVRYAGTPPLRFNVTYDRAGALYDIEGPFGVMLWAESREELAGELEAELNLLFENYAKGDAVHLSSDAKKLRDEIRGRFGL